MNRDSPFLYNCLQLLLFVQDSQTKNVVRVSLSDLMSIDSATSGTPPAVPPEADRWFKALQAEEQASADKALEREERRVKLQASKQQAKKPRQQGGRPKRSKTKPKRSRREKDDASSGSSSESSTANAERNHHHHHSYHTALPASSGSSAISQGGAEVMSVDTHFKTLRFFQDMFKISRDMVVGVAEAAAGGAMQETRKKRAPPRSADSDVAQDE